MANTGDFFETQFVIEIKGVATVSRMFWQLDDEGGGLGLTFNLTGIAQAFNLAAATILSQEAVLTCLIFNNLTNPFEKAIIVSNNPGNRPADSHPQDQPIRFNRYARNDTDTDLRVSAFNLSGVAEDLSTRGRINDLSVFENMRQFLFAQLIIPSDGWTITPQFRWRVNAGPPPVYIFRPIDSVIVNPKFQKLQSRKTRLCGQA